VRSQQEDSIDNLLRLFLEKGGGERNRAFVDLFKQYMNEDASKRLDEMETQFFLMEHRPGTPGERSFCQLFTAEKIPVNIGGFVYFYVTRQDVADDDLRALGNFVSELGEWLGDDEYISEEETELMLACGARTGTELLSARQLAKALGEYVKANRPKNSSNETEGHFRIEKVEPEKLHLIPNVYGKVHKYTVPVSKEVSQLCKKGWELWLALGQAEGAWRIVESGDVYPTAAG
jgi:hypothetical protein